MMIKFKVKELLAKSGKKRLWLVHQLSSNYTQVDKMLDGKTTSIGFSTIELLCRAFKCTPNDLFEITDDDPESDEQTD